MKFTQFGISTQREDPADAEAASHKWLAKGGYIIKHAAGIYTYSPLFMKAWEKISSIVEAEIEAAGASKVQLPFLQPSEPWKKTGRWANYEQSKLMFHVEDRKGGLYGLVPTGEEMITQFASATVNSPKQLPLSFYQHSTKFRDELRPRFGLMRSREFMMMDAYSFDITESGLDLSYQKIGEAYHRIFKRLGINYVVVQADSGAIGGDASEEFMALCEVGEDTIMYSDGYAANLEKAISTVEPFVLNEEEADLSIVETPNVRTMEDLSDYLKVDPRQTAKTLIYKVFYDGRQEYVAAVTRGEQSVNEVKLLNLFDDALDIELASSQEVKEIIGAEIGSIGPVNLPEHIAIIIDDSLKGSFNLVTGCCVDGQHAINVTPGKDFSYSQMSDIRLAQVGDMGPTGSPLQADKGMEIGHMFKLGAKYSEPLQAKVADVDGKLKPFQMGCYGIGTTRIMSAIIEQNNNDRGILWPISVAPFEVEIVPIKYKDDNVREHAERLYNSFRSKGIDCLLDDRDSTAGVKFSDADLIGSPVVVVIGKGLKDGLVEVRDRHTQEAVNVPIEEVENTVSNKIAKKYAEFTM